MVEVTFSLKLSQDPFVVQISLDVLSGLPMCHTPVVQHSGEPEYRCRLPIIWPLENGYRSNVVLYGMGSLNVCGACIFDTWAWPNVKLRSTWDFVKT